MRQEVVTLQELVQWSVLGLLAFGLLSVVFVSLRRRRLSQSQRKLRRHCAQCGLWEEVGKGENKFGTCQMCGGVTTRGRTRKLG